MEEANANTILMNQLVEQIASLKNSVEQLRNETSQNQTETQRLRETIDRQVQVERTTLEVGQLPTQSPSASSQSSFSIGNGNAIVPTQPYKKLYDLPQFSGKPEDWPLFFANFEETTANFGYSDIENTIRLQKCLHGEARDAVSSLLIHPTNVQQVISALQFRFGRPEQLVKMQISKAQHFPPIADARIDQLIPFSTMVQNMVAFLASAKCEQHLANPMLLEELCLKLPMTRRLDWARHAATIKPYATLRNFAVWLTELAEVVQLVPQTNSSTTAKSTQPNTRRMLHANITQSNHGDRRNNEVLCVSCNANHHIWECETFKNLPVEDRWKITKTKHLCFSCLKVGHGTALCRSRKRCEERECRKFHHKLLHEPSDVTPQISARIHNCQTQNNSSQLFRILPVVLVGPRGQKTIYAMFDEGSSVTILEESIATELGLKGQLQNLTLQWFGDKVVTEPSRKVTLEIQGIERGSQSFQMKNVRTVPNLSLPIQSFDKDALSQLQGIPVSSYKNARPALLIGLDNCHLGVATSVIEDKGIIATHTKLGWVVFGPHQKDQTDTPMVLHIKENANLEELNKLIESYFSIENFGVNNNGQNLESIDDARARRILEESTKRIGKRFETGLLWRQDNITMPDSLPMATKRLYNIEAKIVRDPEFGERYRRQIADLLQKGYARELSPQDEEANSSCTWYLPHFGVTNPNKPGKLRVVFDAAAEVQGTSLNSSLLKGPEQAKSLSSILLKFRQGTVGVVADIMEMFSQVKIRAEDQDFQRFLWRDGISHLPIKTYAMSSMIFGAACSPCAAEYIKNLNAMSFQKESPEAVAAIVNNHYVDDFVCSFSSQAEAERVSQEVKRIHAEGGFVLRNFVSNIKDIQDKLNGPIYPVQPTVNLEINKTTEKVLGMYWSTEDDTFRFHLKFHRIPKDVLELLRPPTKREMLGIVMAVFDPYGFLADFLLYSKLLMQSTWKTGIHWDDPLPQDINSRWQLWWIGLQSASQLRVSRCYSPRLPMAESIELHIFTDASESAFAAVGYLRIQYQGEVDVAFVSGKTRCAPKKLLSIPRLELQAAVLGSRLQSVIRANHNIVINRVRYWSDSKTALWWIRSSQRRYKPFVAHRIAEILDASEPSDWHWLPTDLNVADDATRAMNPPKLSMNSRWLSGPQFLHLPEQQWPHCFESQAPEILDEEIRPKLFHANQASSSLICIANFSSFLRLKRVTAWVMRSRIALSRARQRIATKQKVKSVAHSSQRFPVLRNALTAAEIASAEKFLCQQTQRECFAQELSALQKGNYVPKGSTIHQLTPYLDHDDLLRVNGRIDAAHYLPADARRPIILPQKHPLTLLVLNHFHHSLHHQNDALIINEVRQRYWIPHIRSVLNKVKRNCQQCKINRATPATPLMGQLPPDRLTPYVRPFSYTGLDYFGPLQVSIGRRREKRWVALFTCLTTRAIHLELAGDLSTDALILCLRNFINRRGTPVRIRSDNGTNFIGAKRELAREAELFDTDRIQDEMSSRGIDWKFSCPLNPSEGGVWERLVQAVKKVLLVTLREEAPRVETLRSLLIEAENIVNSRPLTDLPLSSEEDEPLTPNHFLIGCPNSTQTPNLDDNFCGRKQWRICLQLKNRLWKKWVQDYLPRLITRNKWHEGVPPLKIDDLVIICDASQPRSKWHRGKIVNVYPAKDGQVRSADVKTTQGILRRPASKLAVLQVQVDGDGESRQEFTEGGMSPQRHSQETTTPQRHSKETTTARQQ